MPDRDEQFDLLLERCNAQLAEIGLHVPELESSAAPKRPVISLLPEPAPKPPPAQAPPTPLPRSPEPGKDEDFAPLQPARAPSQSPTLWQAGPVATTPPPIPAAARTFFLRPRLAASLAVAVLSAAALGTWLSRRATSDLSLDVDLADAMAVRSEKGDLLVAEGPELATLAQDGRVLERIALDSPVECMQWDQGSLWTSDGAGMAVLERRSGVRPTVFQLNHIPGSFFVKNKYLWTAEKGGRSLHQYLISRSILGVILQPLDIYDLPGLRVENFTLDEAGTLWLVDADSRRLYRLRTDNGSYKSVDSAALSPFIGPSGEIRSLSIDGASLWILKRHNAGNKSRLRRIPLSGLDWTPV